MNTFSRLREEISFVYGYSFGARDKALLFFNLASRGNFFHMKGQRILPRLNDFPGETGKCGGNFSPYEQFISPAANEAIV